LAVVDDASDDSAHIFTVHIDALVMA
jgi:hypothetical protein